MSSLCCCSKLLNLREYIGTLNMQPDGLSGSGSGALNLWPGSGMRAVLWTMVLSDLRLLTAVVVSLAISRAVSLTLSLASCILHLKSLHFRDDGRILVVDTVSWSFKIHYPFLDIFKGQSVHYLGHVLDHIW